VFFHFDLAPLRAKSARYRFIRSSRYTTPPFITKLTRSSSVISLSGSPRTAIRTATTARCAKPISTDYGLFPSIFVSSLSAAIGR
jgi:hypothetical protein